jgi:hypothetical protein
MTHAGSWLGGRSEIRRLRDVTRYRCDLVETRTAEKQRVEKLLEDAQLKTAGAPPALGVVAQPATNAATPPEAMSVEKVRRLIIT